MLEHYPNKGIDMTLHETAKDAFKKDKNLQGIVRGINLGVGTLNCTAHDEECSRFNLGASKNQCNKCFKE
jgi:hypothetical protein